MDLELNADQSAILEAVDALLAQQAGAARAIALQPKGDYDWELDAALREAGFASAAREQSTGPLEAALIVDAAVRAAGVVAIGAEALVAPGTSERELATPIALATSDSAGPVRFAAHARTLLVAHEDEARAVPLEAGDVEAVRSNFGYPMGRIRPDVLSGGDPLGAGSGARMRRWWRAALAVEAAGTMSAALAETVSYTKERRQFGRAIGSFQGVQHRLANLAIQVEGSRWLAYEAVYKGAPEEAVAVAAAYALDAAGDVFVDTHQLTGAIGFTREHDLHVFSMRLQSLRLELGGVSGHSRALARARWGAKS